MASAGPWSRRATIGLLSAFLSIVILLPAPTLAATSGGWSNLGHGATASVAALNQKVETFTSVGSLMYVGGDFTNAGGIAAADHIATWNGTAWAAVGGGLGDAASAVYAIAVDTVTGNVYAGGSFNNAGGDANADRIAVYDGTSWHSLGGVSIVGTVFALAIVGRTLYVGGSFANVNGIPAADGVAAWGLDGGGWSAITTNSGDIGGTVATIVPDGAGGIYVGGSFLNAAGIAAADFIARWNGGTWSALGSNGAGNGAIADRVFGIAVSGGSVYATGDFINAGAVNAADKVARFDGANWSAVGSSSVFGEAAATRLDAIVIDSGIIFVAGYFTNAGGNALLDGIAAFTGSGWTNVGTSADGTNGPVPLNSQLLALRMVSGKLYAGGLVASIGGGSLAAFAASYRVHQPDAQIATTGAFVGNNVYNATGASQTLSLTVHRSSTGTFKLKFANDGFALNSFSIKGPGSAGGFTATYLAGTTDVTAQVVAGTYSVGVARGGAATLTLKIKVGAGVTVGTSRSWVVTQTFSGGGATIRDAVKAVVKAS